MPLLHLVRAVVRLALPWLAPSQFDLSRLMSVTRLPLVSVVGAPPFELHYLSAPLECMLVITYACLRLPTLALPTP